MLSHFRVVDLTDGGATIAGRLLADLGAEVVLVEPPGGITLPATVGDWSALLYMAVVAGAMALVVQTWAQARMTASGASTGSRRVSRWGRSPKTRPSTRR